MTIKEIEKEVIETIRLAILEEPTEEGGTPPEIKITGSTIPSSGGLSSLSIVNCITVLENKLGIDIPADENIFIDKQNNSRERSVSEIVEVLFKIKNEGKENE